MRLRKAKKYRNYSAAKRKLRIKALKNHPFIIPLTTFLVLFFVTIVGFIAFSGSTLGASDSYIVIVSYDGKKNTVPTRAATVGEFLTRAKIEVREGDRIEPAPETPLDQDNFKVNVYRGRPVVIIDGDRKINTYSAATTPRSVAQQAGIEIYPEDGITSKATENILREQTVGEQVIIDRATPVNLNLYGTALVVRTRAKTVSDLLKEKEVKLAEGDSVQPAVETALTPQIQVFIIRKGIKIVTEEKVTPPPTEVIEDSNLSVGASAVRQQGSPGKKIVTYQIELQNDREVARHVIQEVIVVQPVKHIVARGPRGSFGDALSRLRQCESGGNYANKRNPTYRGAYQYDYATWNNYGGIYDPADAPPAIQDEKATETYRRRGWQPWPACSTKLGLQDIYR